MLFSDREIRMNKIVSKCLVSVTTFLIGFCISLQIDAQNLNNRHPWIAETPKLNATAFFTNLQNNDIVKSPFIVQFGMDFWGILPAGHDGKLSGHHHLLVDTPLPMLHLAPLPFTDKYLHFGKGQMQGLVSLSPGKHTLRLLLADHKHVPHFVFSKEIEITVLPEAADKAALEIKSNQPALFFININDGDSVRPYFKVQFHAAGLNISNKSSRLPDTGYFQIQITQSNGKIDKLPFPSGQTEAWLRLPDGKYIIQLEFITNPSGDLHPVKGKEITINVASK